MNAELKDICLGVAVAEAQAGARLGPGWRVALALLNGVRRWIVPPTLLPGVPFLVMLKGTCRASASTPRPQSGSSHPLRQVKDLVVHMIVDQSKI
jgi:hypothetical protein